MTEKALEHTPRTQAIRLASQGADPYAVVASSGISLRLWRLYAQFWLVCLLFPVLFLAQSPMPPMRLGLAITGLVLFVGTYTWFVWPHPGHERLGLRYDRRRAGLVYAGLVILVVVLSVAYGAAFLWLFVGVSAVAGVAFSPYRAFVVVMALTLVTLGLGIARSGSLAQTDWLHLIPLVLLVRGLGLDMTGLTRLAEALRELHRARGELARRAVTEERLRLARDLHDLLGHTLSLITLKSELAGRLVDKQPAQAAQEIREVEQEARRALREVREAVAGYRQPTLHGELEAARQMLAAAGIGSTIEHTADTLPTAVDGVLAWAVREGVTNVIRHSRAHHCTLRVVVGQGGAMVELMDDGEVVDPRAAGAYTPGSGLSGLAERVAAVGGQLEAGVMAANGRRGFRLWVRVPISGGPEQPA